MSRSYTYVKTDMLDIYKVYCFSEIFLTKEQSVRNTRSYEIGDFIPNVGRSFIYKCNLLIIDLFNSVVHIIENCIYKKSIKVTKDTFFDCLLGNVNFNRDYMVLDTYGRELNVSSLNELKKCLISYPRVEIFIENHNSYKHIFNKTNKDNKYGNGALVLNDICINLGEISTVRGDFYGKDVSFPIDDDYEILGVDEKESIDLSFKALNSISTELSNSQKEVFNAIWLKEEGVSYYTNKLLNIFDVLYKAYCLNINKPFTYYHLDIKKYTHKNRLLKEVLAIMESLEDDLLEDVIFQIFAYIEDEDYLNFIIEVLAILADEIVYI